MRTLALALSLLVALPAVAKEQKFDEFLPKFRKLYAYYHMGPSLARKDIDLIAVRIWHGSGQNYLYASTTASQGILETHYLRSISHGGHKGDVGMRNKTILYEARRQGLIKRLNDRWILRYCEKNPAFADKLAASRFVYLNGIFKDRRITIFHWVRGNGWKTNDKDLQDVVKYWGNVEKVRIQIFGEGAVK